MGRKYQAVAITLTTDEVNLLDRLANEFAEGNRSRMVRSLLATMNPAGDAEAREQNFATLLDRRWLPLPASVHQPYSDHDDGMEDDPPMSPKEEAAFERILGERLRSINAAQAKEARAT